MIKGLTKEVQKNRKANFDIDTIFLNRWSPRSMTGEELKENEFMPLFEAARWAPSSYNAQQWRFLYAKRNTKNWGIFLELLAQGNNIWAKKAGVLVVIISRKNFEHNEKPSITHIFDAGAAWENLALEGARRGLVVHGMEGFDYASAKKVLEIPDNFAVCAMVAIGRRGKKEDLPEDYQDMEQPNGRKPLNVIAIEGKFKGK